MAKKLPQNAIIINGKVYELVDNKSDQTDCDICDLKKVCFKYYEEILCVDLFDSDGKTFKLIK